MTAKFDLGQIVATPGALEAIQASAQDVGFFLDQHVAARWGVVSAEDARLNDEALVDGGRLLSAYKTLKGVKLWIITEAEDDDGKRTTTTILLPADY